MILRNTLLCVRSFIILITFTIVKRSHSITSTFSGRVVQPSSEQSHDTSTRTQDHKPPLFQNLRMLASARGAHYNTLLSPSFFCASKLFQCTSKSVLIIKFTKTDRT